jgi:tetratricopeptide (TPR) repeat protein
LVIALARRYAEGSPEDFDSALAGLEHALKTAAEEREKGRLPGNVSDAVDAIMARVDALNEAGEIDAAEAALVAELDRQEAAQARLIDKGIAQAVLTRNVDLALRLELKKLTLDGGGFEALRDVQVIWYERGRDKGLRFDLEVAIALARESVNRAADADQKGAALNDLGTVLQVLGERESDTARLQEAVTAYTEALMEWTRERVPLQWATTQNNLGLALTTLGERESGTARLLAAITTFNEALEECTRERVPLDWAMTQMNLGNALSALGARESDTARLREAVAAYTEALKERTRARVPLQWATTQANLGTTLKVLGVRESGTDRLQAAVTAFNEALEERTPEQVPLQWAITQVNLCDVELAFFDKIGEAENLDRAQDHLDHARAVFDAAQASQYQAKAENLQREIDARRANLRQS